MDIEFLKKFWLESESNLGFPLKERFSLNKEGFTFPSIFVFKTYAL